MGYSQGEAPDLLSASSNMTRGNGIKLHEGKCRLKISVFIEREDGHHKWLPREVTEAPSLLEFKECLENALSHGLVLGSPAKRLKSASMDPFSLEIFDDSTILCLEFSLNFLSDPQLIRKEYNENRFLTTHLHLHILLAKRTACT